MEKAPFHAPAGNRESLDQWILDDPEASFLMKMQGNAMHEHGIYHGDMLIVERATEARSNDLVITVRNGGWTIMTYEDVMKATEPITIQAIIRGLVRKYNS